MWTETCIFQESKCPQCDHPKKILINILFTFLCRKWFFGSYMCSLVGQAEVTLFSYDIPYRIWFGKSWYSYSRIGVFQIPRRPGPAAEENAGRSFPCLLTSNCTRKTMWIFLSRSYFVGYTDSENTFTKIKKSRSCYSIQDAVSQPSKVHWESKYNDKKKLIIIHKLLAHIFRRF